MTRLGRVALRAASGEGEYKDRFRAAAEEYRPDAVSDEHEARLRRRRDELSRVRTDVLIARAQVLGFDPCSLRDILIEAIARNEIAEEIICEASL